MKISLFKGSVPENKKPRIGIMGGSFDPVHKTHIEIARRARKEFNLEKIFFVPAKRPPHKPDRRFAPLSHRLRMLKKAIKGDPFFKIDLFEAKRDKTTYTIDTIKYFALRFPKAKVFFIMGSDSLNDMPKWKSPKEIMSASTLIVAKRRGANISAANKNKNILFIRHLFPAVSSTLVRSRYLCGKSISSLVDPDVDRYIERNKLYEKPLS